MARDTGCPGCQPTGHSAVGWENAERGHSVGQREEMTDLSGPRSTSNVFNPYYTGRPRTPANGQRQHPIDRQELIRRIKSGDSTSTSPEGERPPSRSTFSHPPQDAETLGLQIERPRSALHRGDFREKKPLLPTLDGVSDDRKTVVVSTSPVAPWRVDFPSMALPPSRLGSATLSPGREHHPLTSRPRAVSNASWASGFTYKPPTSPLVQTSRPDTPDPALRHHSPSPDKYRRHTFSPRALQGFGSGVQSSDGLGQTVEPVMPSPRPEGTFPYQAHQPRRSIHSFASVLPTTRSGLRRPSLSDSPLHHAPMVGSYEESILRGRMSTQPSKPLDFVAQIGVLGKGDCKPSLRCPPHVVVRFPAVFYSYSTGTGTTHAPYADQPSPYVGLVDLENNIPPAPSSPERRRRRAPPVLHDDGGSRTGSPAHEDHEDEDDMDHPSRRRRRRRRPKEHRRSRSPRYPPGGSYRIPQQGQLQIVIKNPNKTAVKLFLVPYDLSDMEPESKTFVRQRSYSAGPISDRPTLRYLVHLHICCPSRGRFFLYQSIRLVFANRVPDGEEALRHEIQLPYPRYSSYKPRRDVIAAATAATPCASLPSSSVLDSISRPSLARSLPQAGSTDVAPLAAASPFVLLPALDSRPPSRRAVAVDARTAAPPHAPTDADADVDAASPRDTGHHGFAV